MPAGISAMFVHSKQQTLCVSHAVEHNLQPYIAQMWAVCWIFPVSLESPDKRSLHVTIISESHWSALYSPKSLRVSMRIVQASWLGLHVLSGVQRKIGSGAAGQWDGALSCMNQCAVVDGEQHDLFWVPMNYLPQNDSTMQLLVWYVRQWILSVHHSRCSPSRWWKTNVDALMPQWHGDCHQHRHWSYKNSQYEYLQLFSPSYQQIGCCLWSNLREAIGIAPLLLNGQEEWGLALAGCDIGKATLPAEFSYKANIDIFSSCRQFQHYVLVRPSCFQLEFNT
jgi:hypothetical protein